jgi:Protein of unknown function (DUF2844)
MMKILPFLNVVLVGGGLLLIGAPSAARATLGEPAASVADDAAQMNATAGANPEHPMPGLSARDVPTSANFTVEQITTPEGTVVSEYVDQGGTVFAVTWRGSMPPDVRALLGTYFKQYSDAANTGAPSPLGLHASSVHASDVTVETGGHMGFMWGRAYLPARMPAGVSLSEIR